RAAHGVPVAQPACARAAPAWRWCRRRREILPGVQLGNTRPAGPVSSGGRRARDGRRRSGPAVPATDASAVDAVSVADASAASAVPAVVALERSGGQVALPPQP
ncbi:MAG TPA: hypothetical protein VGP05_20490, partial [Pseudonocardia sp.]|nr:hypothetical protein [Pseudonocardia sp.]